MEGGRIEQKKEKGFMNIDIFEVIMVERGWMEVGKDIRGVNGDGKKE